MRVALGTLIALGSGPVFTVAIDAITRESRHRSTVGGLATTAMIDRSRAARCRG